ncbi:uncharacterized protein [Pseudorasbora parva]|uniref:uncharacterized protein n=1 Tax=Pseudorasbora parva TaxID=51549 RepID=UPI00351F2879
MDRFSASVHQAVYKSSALAVRTLNVSSLLSAYQAEILDDLGQQLDKGSSPSPALWKEIITVNDLVLRNARQVVQTCGRSMALSVVGERSLWLNLSGLPDSEKKRIAGAPVEPGRALFGPAVAMMQQRCDDKKEHEAFILYLPRKTVPRQAPPVRLPNPPVPGRNFNQVKEKPRKKFSGLSPCPRTPVQRTEGSCCRVSPSRGCPAHMFSGRCVFPPVQGDCLSPLEGAIASQISQLGMLEASTAWTSIHTSCVSAWLTVLRMILQGYRLQIAMKHPRFSSVLFSHTEESTAHVLKEEISSHLNKGAIQVVPHNLINQGFFSRYFLVTKKDGSLRPILDPRVLNKHLRKYRFIMLTLGSLARVMKRNDWFTSVDLRDAFLHISIYPPHRKFLRFAYQGICYELTVLPFGQKLSPRTFCLRVEAGFTSLRMSGLRILTYICDWLIIADSWEKVLQDTSRVLAHTRSLDFRVNVNKSSFTPSQRVIFQGMELNSVSMRARLSQERVLSLTNCLSQFREGARVRYRTSQATGSYGFSYPVFATRTPEDEGVHEMGFVTTFQSVTRSLPLCNSDAHLRCSSAPLEERGLLRTGYPSGDCHVAESRDDGRVPNRLGCHPGGQNCERFAAEQTTFRAHRLFRASNQLEGSESFSASSAGTSCARTLRRYHDSGYQSSRRRALAEASCPSLQAFGMERASFPVVTRDSCSGNSEQRRGSSIEGEPALRRLAPPPSDSRHDMDETTGARRSVRLARKQPLSYVLLAKGLGRAPRGGHTGPPVAQSAAVCLSSPVPDNSHTGQGERGGVFSHPDSTQVAQSAVAGRDNPSVVCPAVVPPPPHRPIVLSERGDLSPTPGQGSSLGLARERTNLSALGLPPRVVATIQNARAVSTRSLYGCKWQVFDEWCDGRGLTSYQCSVADILCFLQDLMDKGRSFSTVKVYLAAISACHVGFEGSTVGQHSLIRRFMKGARRSLPVIRRTIPEWDLSMVLEALSQFPFEPLGNIPLKLLSFKTALLLALASAKRVSELHALSVHPSCINFSLGGDKVFLKPNPAFMPKCFPAFTSEVLELSAFHPPPFSSAEDQRLNALCPVRALQTYVSRTSAFRKSDQLFVSWAPPRKGDPLSKQRLSHWLVDAIILAYESKGVQPPGNIRAHSTRGLAASWALFRGVSLQDICSAASWASPHTFVRYYRLDVTRTSVAHSVLGVGSS